MKSDECTLTRRQMIRMSAGALAGLTVATSFLGQTPYDRKRSGIPLVHITDLYHPPQDPDDLLDLLTVAGLRELDLKGVILDVTQKFLDPAPTGFDIARDPGFTPVTQLAHLLGRTIPVASGPSTPLKTPTDPATDRPDSEQEGIRTLIDVLRQSPEPVLVSCVGSARVLAAAFNREPELLRSKVKAAVMNAGATGGTKREWNVGLDLFAFVRLWQSGLPILWYPCATERSAFNASHERGTYWKASHADLFKDIPPPLRTWIAYNFRGEKRDDFIAALSDEVSEETWKEVCDGERNMWSTASLVMAAGRSLAQTSSGWRFLSSEEAVGHRIWPWRLDPIEATTDNEGWISWNITRMESRYAIFGREGGIGYGAAMAEAFNALLKELGEMIARSKK